jgi:hypothetical protein
MSLPEFAKDFRVRGDIDDHILASGDIVLVLYERRHQDELKKGPLVMIPRQKKVKRKPSGTLELARREPGSLGSNLIVGYADLTGGPSLVHHFLWLLARFGQFMRFHRSPRQFRMS